MLVNARGRFMQESVPEGRGAMAAVIGIGPDETRFTGSIRSVTIEVADAE